MRISDWSSDVCSSDLFIPGSRMVERNADTFPLTMGLTDEDGCIPGEFEMTVGLSSLSFSYEVDDWKLSIESTLPQGKWVHTTTISTTRPDATIQSEAHRLGEECIRT